MKNIYFLVILVSFFCAINNLHASQESKPNSYFATINKKNIHEVENKIQAIIKNIEQHQDQEPGGNRTLAENQADQKSINEIIALLKLFSFIKMYQKDDNRIKNLEETSSSIESEIKNQSNNEQNVKELKKRLQDIQYEIADAKGNISMTLYDSPLAIFSSSPDNESLLNTWKDAHKAIQLLKEEEHTIKEANGIQIEEIETGDL